MHHLHSVVETTNVDVLDLVAKVVTDSSCPVIEVGVKMAAPWHNIFLILDSFVYCCFYWTED